MITWYESNGKMGALPDWHRIVNAAEVLPNTSPLQFLDPTIPGTGFWLIWAEQLMIARDAGRKARKRQRDMERMMERATRRRR